MTLPERLRELAYTVPVECVPAPDVMREAADRITELERALFMLYGSRRRVEIPAWLDAEALATELLRGVNPYTQAPWGPPAPRPAGEGPLTPPSPSSGLGGAARPIADDPRACPRSPDGLHDYQPLALPHSCAHCGNPWRNNR